MLSIFLSILFLTQTDPATKDTFLTEVNAIRQEGCKCGSEYFKPAAPVIWNETLEKTAYLHSKDMNEKKYFSHTSKNGDTPAQRLKKQNYVYWSFAENIFSAQGYTPSPKEVVLAWKNSPTHCKNLMNDTVKEMGVGIYKGHYTQLFGSRQTK